jgi:hypothetical protein
MCMATLRIPRWLSILVVVAFFGAAIVQFMPAAVAATGDMTMIHHGQGDKAMPCKAASPVCTASAGCMVMVSLTAPNVPALIELAWPSSVAFRLADDTASGRSIAPDLGPPILLT